jgi:hypothetical protein
VGHVGWEVEFEPLVMTTDDGKPKLMDEGGTRGNGLIALGAIYQGHSFVGRRGGRGRCISRWINDKGLISHGD